MHSTTFDGVEPGRRLNQMEIPVQQQIQAMLNGRLPTLLRDCGIDPDHVDMRRFITVGRAALVAHLVAHPGDAEAYLGMHEGSQASHDVARLYLEKSEYVTCWMDHGAALSVRRFATIGEAVAEHVLMSSGLY